MKTCARHGEAGPLSAVHRRKVAAAVALTLLTAACSSSSPPPSLSATPAPSGAGGPAGSAAQPRRYESLEEIAAAFDCERLVVVGSGGNAGLETMGVCNVGSHNVDIYMTTQRSLWEHLAELFPAVFGPGWIVVCPTGEPACRRVRERIGGRVVLPENPFTPPPNVESTQRGGPRRKDG